MKRFRIIIQGAVQGVGYRPFIYRLANKDNLTGSVANTAQGVIIEIQGAGQGLEAFLETVQRESPPAATVSSIDIDEVDPIPGDEKFEILSSDESAEKTVTILPDLAVCPDCLAEIIQPEDRRCGYAFTNCTNCGPRFSIINDIPYDRSHTEMRIFPMCPDCDREYHDPADRRFHAQPNACPVCGPHLSLKDEPDTGNLVLRTAALIEKGDIIALKGIGGYQLLCDARNEAVVKRLRMRKHREEKPFAVMFPSLEMVGQYCSISGEEEQLLRSLAAPIVLLTARSGTDMAPSVAPANPCLGVMLPYTPLHYLLMSEFGFPVVCTSGNLYDEPIAIAEKEAFGKLSPIADAFLIHNRPIARHMDDSVVRHTNNGTQYFRRARGYAPHPIQHDREMSRVLAVGAHYKNTIAISFGKRTILSQHIGDLSTLEAHQAFKKVVLDLPRLYDFTPEVVACDLHPDFLSTQYAESLGLPISKVQHHHAHVAAVMAEHDSDGPVLGIAWDGTGLGDDNTIWGGEFLVCEKGRFERVAYLEPFPLVGGDAAIQEPRRTAMGLLHKAGIRAEFPHGLETHEAELVQQALEKSLNAPLTSSVGRLFDGIAALLGLRQLTTFEGQSAMALEFAARGRLGEPYSWELGASIEWGPLLMAVLKDRDSGIARSDIASRFHGTLIDIMVQTARKVGLKDVVLSGGCFQNKLLYEGGRIALERAGFKVFLPRQLPVNDGGIAAGQIWIAQWYH